MLPIIKIKKNFASKSKDSNTINKEIYELNKDNKISSNDRDACFILKSIPNYKSALIDEGKSLSKKNVNMKKVK